MTDDRARGATRYARAIERLWSAATERPVILSPRDWALICDWHDQGIPLPLIEEAILAVAERRAGRPAPKGLSYLASTIEESWRVVREGRLSESEPALADPQTDRLCGAARAAWARRAAAEQVRGSALGRELDRLLRDWDAGRPVEEIEHELDEGLERWVTVEVRDEMRRSVVEGLRPFRERMSESAWNRTVRSSLLARLRERLGLVRLPPGPACDS